MKIVHLFSILLTLVSLTTKAQIIPIDTAHWEIEAQAYVLENHKGVPSIYLQGGSMTLKDQEFLNGTIEYDIHLKEEQAFPGIYFRGQEDSNDAEHFYIRPHQSGNPDANQTAPLSAGIVPWQLYYGTRYSFPYEYQYDDWTHVKIIVNGDKAQVFLDHSEKPNLSWDLFHPTRPGVFLMTGGNRSGMHIANIQISHEASQLVDFNPIEKEPIPNLIQQWEISEKFEEAKLEDINNLQNLIDSQKWLGTIEIEEGTAANISRKVKRYDGNPGNTVLAKFEFDAEEEKPRLFEFGYSDRVVVIFNGKPIYRGNNNFRSRDYRYLGTIGLFDSVYLDPKKGKNTIIMAVSEDFGGWLVTGRFAN